MSATSGITVAPELSAAFTTATASSKTRFVKVSIQKELLVHDRTIDTNGSLNQDLQRVPDILSPDSPAYLLVRLDDPAGEWLAVSYVPDTAKIRDKMIYASTRATLLKSLGASLFTSSLFATSLADLTPTAYAAHLKHIAAPPPLSAREAELAAIRAAERESSSPAYTGSGARANHIGSGVGLKWGSGVEAALKRLGEGSGSGIVVIKIDAPTETLALVTESEVPVNQLSSKIPASEPSYAFFAWPHTHTTPPRREIVFIYACPSSSPIKHRMLYSSGATGVFAHAKTLLPGKPTKPPSMSSISPMFRAGIAASSTFRNSSGTGSGAISVVSPGGTEDSTPSLTAASTSIAVFDDADVNVASPPPDDDSDRLSDKVRDENAPSAGSFFASPPSSRISNSAMNSVLASRKIETSDPGELDEEFLVAELGLKNTTGGSGSGVGRGAGYGFGGARTDAGSGAPSSGGFQKPKGPPRRGAGAGRVAVFPS